MLQSAFMRSVALIIWVPSIILTWLLVKEFTEGQSEIIAGIAMISLLVSSVSLLSAQYAFRRGDSTWGWSSVTMYVLGAAVMVFLELGFWNSTILSSHTNMVRADSAREGVELLKDQQREQIRTGKIPETAAEIAAKMDVQLATPIGNQPLGRITNRCGDTQSAAFRLCGEYLTLKAAYAKAERIEQIQKATWDNGTSVEVSALKRDIFSGATAMSGMVGGSPKTWAVVFSLVLMALLMATRDLSGLGAFGPKLAMRRAEAQGEPEKVVVEFPVRSEPIEAPAPVEAPVAAPEPEPRLPDAASFSHSLTKPTPPPSNGGTRSYAAKPKTETGVVAAQVSDAKVVNFTDRHTAHLPAYASDFFDESAPPVKHKAMAVRREAKKRKSIGGALAWLECCTFRTNDPSVTVTSDQAWKHYLAHCESEGNHHLPRSKFHRVVNGKVGSSGGRYIGLVLADAEQQQLKATG